MPSQPATQPKTPDPATLAPRLAVAAAWMAVRAFPIKAGPCPCDPAMCEQVAECFNVAEPDYPFGPFGKKGNECKNRN